MNLLKFLGLESTLFAFSLIIVAMMWKADEALNERFKNQLAQYMKTAHVPDLDLIRIFSSAFDQLFSTSQYHRPSLVRSSMVSLLWVTISAIAILIINPQSESYFTLDSLPNPTRWEIVVDAWDALLVVACVGLVADYFSIWTTRSLMSFMGRRKLVSLLILLFDFYATFFILGMTGMTLLLLVPFLIFGHFITPNQLATTLDARLWSSLPVNIASFMSSIWLWLYLISVGLYSLRTPLNKSLSFFFGRALSDDTPMRSIGVFVGIVTFVIFTPFVILAALLS